MRRIVKGLVDVLKLIGAVSIAGMMFLTCADVVMRAFGRPIWGAVEISGFLATIALACAMPYTHVVKGHVGVDMLVRRLSFKLRTTVDIGTGILGTILFIIISWQSFCYASTLRECGEVSMTLEFPTYLLVYFIGFAFAVLSLSVLSDLIESIKKVAGK